MSIFRREDEAPESPSMVEPQPSRPAPPRSRPVAPPTQTTQIAQGLKFRGEITGSSNLSISGEVDGKLNLEGKVIIEDSGFVRGEIQAKEVCVGGRVEGNILGEETIEILGKGSVKGDVKSPRVMIADGAFFKGNVEMGG